MATMSADEKLARGSGGKCKVERVCGAVPGSFGIGQGGGLDVRAALVWAFVGKSRSWGVYTDAGKRSGQESSDRRVKTPRDVHVPGGEYFALPINQRKRDQGDHFIASPPVVCSGSHGCLFRLQPVHGIRRRPQRLRPNRRSRMKKNFWDRFERLKEMGAREVDARKHKTNHGACRKKKKEVTSKDWPDRPAGSTLRDCMARLMFFSKIVEVSRRSEVQDYEVPGRPKGVVGA